MKIEIGDRVRAKTSCEGAGTVIKYWIADGSPGTSDGLTVRWDSGMQSGIAVASVIADCDHGTGKNENWHEHFHTCLARGE